MSKKKEKEIPLTVDTGVEEPLAQEVVTEVEQTDEQPTSRPRKKPAKPETEETPADTSLKELIQTHGTEEAKTASGQKTLGKVLGGDILTSPVVKRQIGLLLLLTAFIIVYISNGYSYRRSLIEIDKLSVRLKEAKIESLTSTSRLTKLTRETRILQVLREHNDTLLKRSNVPPIIIYDDPE